ncbi:hypothetical protein FLL45_20045 [Aliikangiella marina]|uniref:TonB C-terminal domain-containing protein n=1 Tax=Aliikangiella marina TaxID=1712262 RepID=A0A545T2L5_9GAMM|nr:hypothetical protein [Aliikangiella marina]TQV71449.1 hypothetical protein FLL45_20045 [Aliikangiella marina]
MIHFESLSGQPAILSSQGDSQTPNTPIKSGQAEPEQSNETLSNKNQSNQTGSNKTGPNQAESNKRQSVVNGPAALSSILPPVYEMSFRPGLELITVSALLDISDRGEVTRIAELQITPDDLAKDEIIRAIFLAKFIPQIDRENPIETENFVFEWQFKVKRLPNLKLDSEIELELDLNIN